MFKTAAGAKRYNDKMDKIFTRSHELNMKNHGKDEFDHRDEKRQAFKSRPALREAFYKRVKDNPAGKAAREEAYAFNRKKGKQHAG